MVLRLFWGLRAVVKDVFASFLLLRAEAFLFVGAFFASFSWFASFWGFARSSKRRLCVFFAVARRSVFVRGRVFCVFFLACVFCVFARSSVFVRVRPFASFCLGLRLFWWLARNSVFVRARPLRLARRSVFVRARPLRPFAPVAPCAQKRFCSCASSVLPCFLASFCARSVFVRARPFCARLCFLGASLFAPVWFLLPGGRPGPPMKQILSPGGRPGPP